MMPSGRGFRSGRLVLERAVRKGEAARIETWMGKRASSRFGLRDGRRDHTGSRFRAESLRFGGDEAGPVSYRGPMVGWSGGHRLASANR